MTSKKRKLEYIREKNHYRKGGDHVGWFKVPSGLSSDKDFINSEIESVSKMQIDYLKKKFKINFKISSLDTGMIADDFVKGLFTIRFKLNIIQYD